MNSLFRVPAKPPVKLSVNDFEVLKTEELTRSATVLLLDLSHSMPRRGNFEAAKQVALALDELIRTRYPKDRLFTVGFSTRARQLKREELPYICSDMPERYTNVQQGLFIARGLLSREKCHNKQVILISDGEPTAHIEDKEIFCRYPPDDRTLQLTLQEVKNCTRKGIIINTFIFQSADLNDEFVREMARVNNGRVLFTSARNLGKYLLVDYISNRKKVLQ
jgi:uncharacterized protein with von Willebrand factor type A (vWA) domain